MMIYLEKNGGSSQFATLKKALPGHIQIAKMLVPSLQKIPRSNDEFHGLPHPAW